MKVGKLMRNLFPLAKDRFNPKFNIPSRYIKDKSIELEVPTFWWHSEWSVKTTGDWWGDNSWIGYYQSWSRPFLARVYEIISKKFKAKYLAKNLVRLEVMRNSKDDISREWKNTNPYSLKKARVLTFVWTSHPSIEIYTGALSEEKMKLLKYGEKLPSKDTMLLEAGYLYVLDRNVPYRVTSDEGKSVILTVTDKKED